MNKLYKYMDPLYVFPVIVMVVGVGFFGLLALTGVNSMFGTDTVLDTFSGQKTVCSRMQWNASLKTTQCVEHVQVAATCKKVEHRGPIFDTFISTTCD